MKNLTTILKTTVSVAALIFGASFASADSLDSDSAVVSLSVGQYASLTQLDDFVLSLSSGADGDASSMYDGSDEFRVESNCAVNISMSGEDLSNGSGSSISTDYFLDGAESIQTDAGVHNALHTVSAEATLGNISSQEAGGYSANITITVSAI